MSSRTEPEQQENKVSWLTIAILVFTLFIGISIWDGFQKDAETTKSEKTIENGKETIITVKEIPGKNLWDLMSVLGAPASLVILGFWLQKLQNDKINRQLQLERELAQNKQLEEARIAEDNQREEVLQVYIDRLSTLLIDKNLIAVAKKEDRESERTELVRAAEDVIQARTISILRRLREDEERRFHVIQFLIDTEIITLSLDFNKLNFKGFKFKGVNLQKANLAGVDLADGVDFEDTDLRGANLEGANLAKARLRRAKLGGANLEGANFQDAVLQGASFYSVHLAHEYDDDGYEYEPRCFNPTKLMGADFSGANLIEADLAGADLTEVNLNGATLTRAIFIKTYKRIIVNEDGDYYDDPPDDFYAVLKNAKLYAAILEGVVFENVNMAEADLRHARLQGANLKNADLRGANLEGADLQSANLENAKFEGANLKGVKNLTEEQWKTTLDYQSLQRSMNG